MNSAIDIDILKKSVTVILADDTEHTAWAKGPNGDTVMISGLHALHRQISPWDGDLESFKALVISALLAGVLKVTRADIVELYRADQVAASETVYLNATFHKVGLF